MGNTEHVLSLSHGWAESNILLLLSSHFLLSRLHHIDANKDFSETSRICAICAKFPCAIFPHSSLVCKTFPDKRSLDGKNTILSSELNPGKCYKEELFFNARLKRWRECVPWCRSWGCEGGARIREELLQQNAGKEPHRKRDWPL